MNTKHLITFVTFAKKKSFLKTSMELHYAESTLAEHITSLERELGVKLIEAGSRGSRLTKAGEAFLPRAEKILGMWRDVQQQMAKMSGIQSIRIISAESLALNMMPPIYREFLQKYENIPLSISNGLPSTFCDQLKNHDVDIAFGYYWGKLPKDKYECIRICQDELVFFVSPSHRLARRSLVKLEDFADEMFLFTKRDSVYYEEANKLFKSSGMNLNTSFFIDSAELIKKYVSDSRHIGFLARSTLKNEIESGSLVCLEFDGPSMMIDIVAVTLLKSNQEPMIQELIHIAGKYAL